MHDLRSPQNPPATNRPRQVSLLAAVILATVGLAVATAVGATRGSALATASRVSAFSIGGPAYSSGDGFAPGSTTAQVAAGAPAAGAIPMAAAAPAVRVHTMSMDAPIQGGLTAHQEQSLSARLRRAHQNAAVTPGSPYWTPAMGRSALARAQSWIGMPYSWAGGNASGPTAGRCDPGDGADLDCHVVGFDCSGLTMYAWGAYTALPHLADAQRFAGAFHPTVAQLMPGDLVFFAGYLPGGTGHVAVYAGHGMVVEAPQSGSVVRRSELADVMAEDGYRGAVRPLTGPTPALSGPRVALPVTGGTVTLRGTHLANVDAVHVDGVTVTRFASHSDSAIVFVAPAHRAGRVAVTVSTSWQAQSRPVLLTYAAPRPSRTTSTISGTTPSPATTPSTPVATSSTIPGTSIITPSSRANARTAPSTPVATSSTTPSVSSTSAAVRTSSLASPAP